MELVEHRVAVQELDQRVGLVEGQLVLAEGDAQKSSRLVYRCHSILVILELFSEMNKLLEDLIQDFVKGLEHPPNGADVRLVLLQQQTLQQVRH